MKLITVFALPFGGALALYLVTLAPTLTWAHDGVDGGDLITAVYTGGVPHPPGYPTYLLLATPFAALPFGDPAWRLNLFSAVSGACAAGLAAWAAWYLATAWYQLSTGVALVGAWAAGFWLATSRLLWSQAVIAEVYSLQALAVTVVLCLALQRPANVRRGVSAGLGLGIGLGAGPAVLLAAPWIGLLRSRQAWVGWGVGFVAGLLLFGLLPLRALANAPVNWGDPRTLDRWLWVVSARLYAGNLFALSPAQLLPRLADWSRQIVAGFTWPGLGLALWAVSKPSRLHPFSLHSFSLQWASAGTFLPGTLLAIAYNTSDSYVYLAPSFIIVALWAGLGLAFLSQWWLSVYSGRPGRWLPALGGAIVILGQVLGGWSAMDARSDRAAVDFANQALRSAPNRAILVTARDGHTFALWYEHYIAGQRPDVTIVDRDLWGYTWYQQTVGREAPELLAIGPPVDAIAMTPGGRPICPVEPQSGLVSCNR